LSKTVKVNLEETFINKLKHGSDLLEEIKNVCKKNDITLGKIEAIGAVSSVTLAFYNQKTKEYESRFFDNEYEIISLIGNISLKDGEVLVHAHVTLSDENFNTVAGHLMPNTKIFACEAIISKYSGAVLNRGLDEVTKLPLWDM